MMMSIPLLTFQLLTTLQTVSASPLPQHNQHAERNTTSRNIGSGFAIALCVVLLAAVFYYLGMRHERTISWFGRRNPSTTAEPVYDENAYTEGHRLKTRISCPLAVSSSAPIKPYDDPVEAPTPSLRYFELPIKEVHEMGLPSPRKPQVRESWLSLDRKPWWLRYPESDEQRRSTRTSRSKSMRSWFKSDRSMNSVQDEMPKLSPGLVGTVRLDVHRKKEEEQERKSDGSTLMDWSGLDYVRKIYVGRKSRVGP